MSESEIQKLIDVHLEDANLDVTRDIFLFCTFTGLSYSDVFSLQQNNLEAGNDTEWLIVYRQKTEERSIIPLLDVPKSILKKYAEHPKCIATKKLLPVPANQKMNQYLKLIAMYAGIGQRLTTHLARHTFATTIALKNGVPITTVQSALGHSSSRTTQIYAEMTAELMGKDMSTLGEKISLTYKYPTLPS
jgi:site-specific recombinase XerD